jgi:hypothetical protein
MLVPHHASVIL